MTSRTNRAEREALRRTRWRGLKGTVALFGAALGLPVLQPLAGGAVPRWFVLAAGVAAWGAAVLSLAYLHTVAEDHRRAAWTQYEWFGVTNSFVATREVNDWHYLSAFGLVLFAVVLGALHVSSALGRLG